MYLNKLLFVIFLSASFLFAHEAHNKKKHMPKPDTLTIVGSDTIAINGMPTEQFMATHHAEGEEAHNEGIEEEEQEEVKEVTFGAAFEHLHNKLIHFPIALTLIALLLMVVGFKENKYFGAIKIIVPFAAILTIATVITGQGQASPFEGTATYALVETHELLGFGVLAALILWSVALYVEQLKKFIYPIAIITFILVSLAGLYGGVIAH